MARCAAIKPNGERCRGIAATGGDQCPAHDPARAAERKRNARKAALSRGGGAELKKIKEEVRAVIAAVLSGRIDKGIGAVALQGYNTLLRAVEIGQRADLEDLAREVEELKNSGYGGAA
jgi:hypothetical protein